MKDNNIKEIKANIIAIGRLLWDKDLVGGLNGNISFRVNDDEVLITARRTCLGFLTDDGIAHVRFDGTLLGAPEASSEKHLHLEIYKAFSQVKAVIHTHTPYTNAFFLHNDVFCPSTLEAEYVLGEVHGLPQGAINVSDAGPVIERLKKNNMVVLQRHGSVVMGEDLFECFVKIQVLEEQIKMQAVGELLKKA